MKHRAFMVVCWVIKVSRLVGIQKSAHKMSMVVKNGLFAFFVTEPKSASSATSPTELGIPGLRLLFARIAFFFWLHRFFSLESKLFLCQFSLAPNAFDVNFFEVNYFRQRTFAAKENWLQKFWRCKFILASKFLESKKSRLSFPPPPKNNAALGKKNKRQKLCNQKTILIVNIRAVFPFQFSGSMSGQVNQQTHITICAGKVKK